MGHHQSSFNKANFKRGIRGYRQMFASLDLEQKELKKLWIEFGKIDTDNGGTVSIRELLSHCDLDFTPFAYRLFGIFDGDNSGAVDFREFVVSTWNCCTMDHESLVRFAFDLFDRDHSGAIETAEMEAMLREVYGEHFADSPAAALTLKRVKELSSSSNAGPTNETTILALAKNGVQVGPDGRIYALSFEAFREFCRQHAGMLFPAFTLQKRVRSKIVSEAFWKGCADRRNGVRPGRNKGKGGKRSPRKAIQLEHLSTMMSLDEESAAGTTTDNTPAPNGSATGTVSTTAQGNGCAQTPTKALPSPSPAPGDAIKAPSEARKRGSGGNDSSGSSSKTPATAAKMDDAGGCDTPDGSGENVEGQARCGGDGGHEKGTGDGGTPRKRRSGSRGVVVVEGDEGSGGGSENKTARFSLQAPRASREGPNAHRVSGTPSHGGASQPATLRQETPTNGPPTGRSATGNVAKTPQPRQTYPLPIDAGGRGTSAWARGGDEEALIGGGGVPPGFAGGVGEEESAPGRRPPGRRLKKESRVDSPLAAAARAAAVYELPALRDAAATKRRSHQARDLVAGSGGRGGRPASAGGSHSPNARQYRRETGQAAAAARVVAGVAASGGQQAGSSSTTPQSDNANVVRDTHEHHHSPRTFHGHRTVPKPKRATHS